MLAQDPTICCHCGGLTTLSCAHSKNKSQGGLEEVLKTGPSLWGELKDVARSPCADACLLNFFVTSSSRAIYVWAGPSHSFQVIQVLSYFY